MSAAIAAQGQIFAPPAPTIVASAVDDFYEMDWPELPAAAIEEAS